MLDSGPDRWVVLGRLVGSFGVHGWVKVAPLTENPTALIGCSTWWLRDASGWSQRRVIEVREHGAALIARIEGIADREQAAAAKGTVIGLRRDELPPAKDNEVYWADLPGLEVVNLSGELLGMVADVQDNGAQGVLRIRRDDGGPDRLIPFVPPIVSSVDLEAGRVEVEWALDW